MNTVPELDKGQVHKILNDLEPKESSLIAALHELQHVMGFVHPKSLQLIADYLGVPVARVYSVASFYKQIHLEPRGKHIVQVCTGTACHVRGAALIANELSRELEVQPGQTKDDLSVTLETVNCVGACGMAPLLIVDGDYHGAMTSTKTSKLATSIKA